MKNNIKEIGIPNHRLSKEAKATADKELLALRLKRVFEMDGSKLIHATLLSLKYRFEDYLAQEIYDEAFSFGSFLKEYTRILNLKRKELAQDLKIHETKFSRLINNRDEPNTEILYRIEAHSNAIISSTLLYQLQTRKVMHEMENDAKAKKRQAKLVKSMLKK